MSESTQAFLFGISVALAGFLLYLCVTFAGPVVLGGVETAPMPAVQAVAAASMSAAAPAPEPALARLAGVEETF